MKKIFLLILFIPLIVLLTSCATTKFIAEPKTPDMGTLLIGQIEVHVSDWPEPSAMNGVHRRNIQVHLYDSAERKEIKMTSRGEGTFYLVSENRTKMIDISGFMVRTKIEGGPVSTLNLEYGKKVLLQDGKVNNVGRIIFIVEVIGQGPGRGNVGTYIQTSESYKVKFEDIKPWFRETFPESEWNNKEWVNALHS